VNVKQFGRLVSGKILAVGKQQTWQMPMDIVGLLTNLEAAPGSDGPPLTIDIGVGAGASLRVIGITLAPFVSKTDYGRSFVEPIFIRSNGSHDREIPYLLFRDRFFLCEGGPNNDQDRQEVFLRVKKAVYEADDELRSLRSYVANVEAAIEFQKTGPKRDPIPDDVKTVVWSRDGGACVRCGSKDKLHFDHIIPVAKGGSNLPVNIQILCEVCNLKKSDKIAF
jgi:hypothetical protein